MAMGGDQGGSVRIVSAHPDVETNGSLQVTVGSSD